MVGWKIQDLLRELRLVTPIAARFSWPFSWTGSDDMISDEKLTPNFSLYELTATSHADVLSMNRLVSDHQIQKLKLLALLLEQVRDILGVPLTIHSGYRCLELNRLVGSGENSQHLKCEAADFSSKGLDLSHAFKRIWEAGKDGKLAWGQLIFEKAERSYGLTEWIHISTGWPYRGEERCGEVLTMVDNQYHLIETIKQEAA